MSQTDIDPGRRTFLKRVAMTLAAFLGASAGVPLVGAIVGPGLRRDEPPWVPVGSAGDFVVGQPKMVTFGVVKADGYVKSTLTRAVWVYRMTEDQLVIYNGRCTHLGCLVNPQSDTFFCPCHGGVFALGDGRVLDGPPPRSLDRLEYRVENGQIQVQFQDFLVGVPDRVPL